MVENNDFSEIKTIIIDNVKYKTRLTRKYLARKSYAPTDFRNVISFIPGTILKVAVKEGDKVKKGTHLLELEAMKMANNIVAPIDGVIKKINVKQGDMVPKNFILIQLV